MVLLSSSENTNAANSSFAVKKQIYSESENSLTRAVAEYSQWTREEVEDRQAQLAELALQTWSLTFE